MSYYPNGKLREQIREAKMTDWLPVGICFAYIWTPGNAQPNLQFSVNYFDPQRKIKGFYAGNVDLVSEADVLFVQDTAIAFRRHYEDCRRADIALARNHWHGTAWHNRTPPATGIRPPVPYTDYFAMQFERYGYPVPLTQGARSKKRYITTT